MNMDERNPARPDLDPTDLSPEEIASEAIQNDERRDREHMSEVAKVRDKIVSKDGKKEVEQDPFGDATELTPDAAGGPVGELSS